MDTHSVWVLVEIPVEAESTQEARALMDPATTRNYLRRPKITVEVLGVGEKPGIAYGEPEPWNVQLSISGDLLRSNLPQ